MKQFLPYVAIVLAVVAIVIVESRKSQASRAHQLRLAGGDNPVLDEKLLHVLAGRLDVLEEKLELVEGSKEETVPDAGFEMLREQVEFMEAAMEELTNDYVEWSIQRGDADEGEEPDSSIASTRLAMESLLSFQATALNQRVDPETRVQALLMLARFPEEMAAFDPILDGIADLHSQLVEPRSRERLVDCIDGVSDARAVSFLVGLLEDEPDAGVRVEAVRALAKLLNEPGVMNALAIAREADSSSEVRKAAGLALDR